MTIRFTAQEREDNATENRTGALNPGLLGTCPDCQQAYGMEPREFYYAVHEAQDVCDEGSFSWRSCECCGSMLGGDRYAAHALDADGALTHMVVCSDCLLAMAS